MNFVAKVAQAVVEGFSHEMSAVHNPATPYVGPIPGGLQDGTTIIVKGITEHHHNGFLISLQAGPSIDPRNDCAFVFNPRFNENQVVRNSLQGGSWGAEERHGGFPFSKGRRFEVIILVQQNHYKVSVDGRHFTEYNHRIPKHRVTHITVEQGVRVNSIHFEHHGHHHGHHGFPQPTPPAGAMYPGMGPSSYPGADSGPVFNPPVPFVKAIPGGMYPNKMIFISGVPHPNPGRISLYLQCGSYQPRDIAITFDIRFKYGGDRNAIVRNTMTNSQWGPEERGVPYFPFSPNAPYDMIILVTEYSFKIAVNNQHFVEFAHRLHPLGRVDTLRIDGDVRLTQVRFQ